MRYARGLLAFLLVLAVVAESPAQVGIAFRGRRLSTTFYLGSPYRYGIAPGFAGWGRPYAYGLPWGNSVRYSSFVFIQPPPVLPTPILINNPAPAVNVEPDPVPQVDLIDPIIIRPRRPPPDRPPQEQEAPLPGAPRGGFRPVLPEDRARAQQPAPPPRKPPPPPRPEEPNADPKVESARQLAQGKQAFAAREYGRAERQFQQATVLVPNEALPYFLLAQAQFALGKYREAVSSIHAGLRLQRDWPGHAFRPIELYGANVADYADHLDQLRDALRRNPDDPVLLFLLAYQLWFDGQKEEARVLFRQAAARAVDPSFIDLFLRQNLPGDRVVQR